MSADIITFTPCRCSVRSELAADGISNVGSVKCEYLLSTEYFTVLGALFSWSSCKFASLPVCDTAYACHAFFTHWQICKMFYDRAADMFVEKIHGF